MTASFLALAWPPFRVRWARPSSEESRGQHISPHKAAGRSKDQHHRLVIGELFVLIFFELTLSRLLDNSLFDDHRTAAAIHLRSRFPSR